MIPRPAATRSVTLLLFPLALLLTSCRDEPGDDRPEKGDALAIGEAAVIEVVVRPPAEPGPTCRFTIDDDYGRDNLVAHFNHIDWSQPGLPLEEIGMIKPDIEVRITETSGKTHHFELYWGDDSFVDYDSTRMLQTETKQMQHMIIRGMVHHYGTE